MSLIYSHLEEKCLQPKELSAGSRRREMKRKSFTSLVLSMAIIGGSSIAAASDSDDSMNGWQLSLLFDPSPAQQRVEKRGRVMIYNGLRSSDIDRALEEQFDRIDSMMFVNTVITDKQGKLVTDPNTGEVMTEDDGC